MEEKKKENKSTWEKKEKNYLRTQRLIIDCSTNKNHKCRPCRL